MHSSRTDHVLIVSDETVGREAERAWETISRRFRIGAWFAAVSPFGLAR